MDAIIKIMSYSIHMASNLMIFSFTALRIIKRTLQNSALGISGLYEDAGRLNMEVNIEGNCLEIFERGIGYGYSLGLRDKLTLDQII